MNHPINGNCKFYLYQSSNFGYLLVQVVLYRSRDNLKC